MRHGLPWTLAGVLAALMLAACQPQSPDGKAAPPPADAPEAPVAPQPPEAPVEPATKEFTGDLDARGNEPFWALAIRPDKITFTRPDPEPPVVVDNPGAGVDDGQHAVWSTNKDGKTFMVSLAQEECSDGMSDLKYPYLAVVTLGDQTFRGCAFKTGQQPREDAQ
ncbi:hypothetical protein M9M90_01310 [Phenylobacterium sp. LH3H17]|uniref:COG3650 family protein n=1 Tax=Phenylobacterium sp. LH3H17 TaxID=2903901 RepID=UPI0020C93A8D|nr:hypothetical protein [Phenylobacterium sp. LH3H17]UTP39840.1 hypothetical protein M9M90_01310 [Phenylobacterium sp. LH3H17]